MVAQSILQIVDSTFCSPRFSAKKSFFHYCTSDKSVLQCWSSCYCFKHCRALFMKWGLKVFLKYLTPSSDLRDSRPRSPLYIDVSPTSLFFNAGPRFPASSCVRSSQSSMSSSHLNQEVDTSKSGGIFTVLPLDAAH